MASTFSPIDLPKSGDKAIKEIAKTVRDIIDDEHGIKLDENDLGWKAVWTIAYEWEKAMWAYLAANPDKEVIMRSIGRYGIRESKSESGEKAGNKVPYFEPGEEAKLAIKNDSDTEDDDD